MSTIVVTGAAGFIGSHVVQAFLARGERVVGIDNFDPFYERALKQRNADECRDPGYELVEADVTEAPALRSVFARVRPAGIVHLAAKAGVRPSLADPVGFARANVLGTAVVLDEARRAGVSRLVIASSSSVYGNNDKTPFAEDDAVNEPISPYAATKRACELLAHTHWHTTRMPTACLRFFTVYGPRQRPDLAIGLFMRRIAAGRPIGVFGDGSASRDFTYIGDIVAGVLAAYDRVPGHGFRIWNLGSDRPIRLDEMVAAVAGVVGREPVIEPLPDQAGDVRRTWADLTRARTELGYKAATPFREGVARQWAWMKESGSV